MNDIKHLSDHLTSYDILGNDIQTKPYRRTKILGGYDSFIDDRGITQLGETLFEAENMIELGGSLFTLEKIFGAESSLKVDYLEDIMTGVKTAEEIPVTEIYPKDNVVCLFGVGIGGCGESITDVYSVRYHEREIKDMIPLRQTADILTTEEQSKYWFRRNVDVDGVNKIAYYLKSFESEPQIKVLWKDAEGDEDGSEVASNVYNTPDTNTTPIETFIEIVLKVSKNDVREYFVDNGMIEQTRINSIGLFTGVKTRVTNSPETYDYRQVKLFSKLNINNEMLTLSKDLTIVYRIYTS